MEEEEEGVKVISISELLQRSRPLTGASSLTSTHSISPSPPPIDPTIQNPNPNPNPNLKFLKSLSHPTILIGTLTLPEHYTNPSATTLRCSRANCFAFSDGSSTVCCDVLELDLPIIGEKIQVLAWNFIPFKCGGGFLEIIRWTAPSQCSLNSGKLLSVLGSSVDCKNSLKSQYGIHGVIESVSPVSVVQCTMSANTSLENSGFYSSSSGNIRGFLATIVICKCKAFSSKDLEMGSKDFNSHSFTEPVFVYFSGCASSWYPVISKLIGMVVSLSGMKKKLVFIGREESQLMYVTTNNALLYQTKFLNQGLPVRKTVVKGKGECGAYTGTVTGIYMQGMVVELDQGVWLLLTDQLLTPLHSIRVGAIVSVRNVHFVNPKFSWTKVLILGACFRTSITVECFSPMETRCHLYSQSQSHLGKFIDSLAFSARLWVLLVVSCFKKKFAGILSEKEILGSKNKEGMAQTYARSHLPSAVFKSRHGLFMEYCKHDSCGCGNEPYNGVLKLVAPISNFVSHCEATWKEMLLECDSDCDLVSDRSQYSLMSCGRRCCDQSIRRILQSEYMGVILLGSLKISPTSGRLQLIDATGSIDIVVQDLSTWDVNSIYEVNDFTLIMEGKPEHVNQLGSQFNESFSCRNIFNYVPLVREIKLAIYIHFCSRGKSSRIRPFHPCIDRKEKFQELQSGRFDLLYIAHKFPLLQKFQGEQVISDKSSVFAEAIVIPWGLFIAGKAEGTQTTDVSITQLKEFVEYDSDTSQKHSSCKRYKIDQASSGSSESSVGWKCRDLNPPIQVPCLVSVGVVTERSLASSGILCCTNSCANIVSGERRVFLEFMSESFFNYQLLQIGGYYIMKHHEKDMLCSHKDYIDVSGGKLLVTSRTPLRSLSFYSDEFLPNTNPSRIFSFGDSFASNYEVLPEISDQTESILKFDGDRSESTDIYLYLSSDLMSSLEVDLKVSQEGLVKPSVTASVQCSGNSDSGHFMPEGCLTSLRGYVEAVHNSDCSSLAKGSSYEVPNDFDQPKFFCGVTNSACIHVLVDNCIVKIFGALSKHAYLIGFGPGVSAIFYRLLVLGRQNELMLTPTSFIVINSVKVIKDHYSDKCCNPSGFHSVASPNTVPSGLISDIIRSMENKPTKFHCRVVAVYILVMEKNRKVCSHSRIHSMSSGVSIPLAGFIVDDGSSSCCCWTNNERAATLLRLNEENPQYVSGRNSRRSKKSGNDHVDKILKKHDRVIVKNFGSVCDSSCQDLTVSVESDNVFSNSDENLLKFVIINACFATFWTVVGRLMDSNAIKNLEKCCTERDMAMHPMPNIWASEVYYTNPLTEARNTFQELLDR